MALDSWQQVINLDTIYEVDRKTGNYESVQPNIFINGGEVSIYTAEDTPTVLGDMLLEETQVSGHNSFGILPRYIYVTETLATVNSVILTGVTATEVI